MSINTYFDNNNAITFVNVYSKNNPILDSGDECYFLLFNCIDYHIPIICKGLIIKDTFNDVINKNYFISITEIIDTDEVINKYFLNKQISLYKYDTVKNSVSIKSKQYRFDNIQNYKVFKKYLYKSESFFVRNNKNDIIQLRKDYMNIIKNDLNNSINQINELICQ